MINKFMLKKFKNQPNCIARFLFFAPIALPTRDADATPSPKGIIKTKLAV